MGLLEVLQTGEELLEDPTEGLNATLAAVNAEKSTAAPEFQMIEALKAPMPTQITAFPAFQQLPAPGGRIDLLQQKKRQHQWRIEWHALWKWPEQDYVIVAVTIETMGRLLERLCGRGTVFDVLDAAVDVTGFSAQHRQFTIVQLGFRVKEREELP